MNLGIDMRLTRPWGGAAAVLNDVQTMLASLTAQAGAFYDCRYNVTAAGTVASAIDDARGVGVGPQLVVAGGVAYSSANKTLTPNGTTGLLQSAVNAAFDLSLGRTLVYIGTLPSGNYAAGIGNSGVTKYSFFNTATANVKTNASGGGSTVTMPTAPSATRRLAMMSLTTNSPFGALLPTGVGTLCIVRGRTGVNNQVGGDSGGAFASGSFLLQLGGYGGNFMSPVIRAVGVFDRPLSGSDWAKIDTWAQANHAIVSDDTVTRMIYFDGNSLTKGQNATAGNEYPTKVMANASFAGIDWVNGGIGSRTGATQLAQFPTRVEPLFVSNHTKKIYVCWELSNDIVVGSASATTAVNNVKAMCAAAKARGATACIVVTMLPRSDATAGNGKEAVRVAANSALIAAVGTSGIDAVADIASIVNLQTTTNTTYFAADGIHLTDAGYLLVANDATYGVSTIAAAYI